MNLDALAAKIAGLEPGQALEFWQGYVVRLGEVLKVPSFCIKPHSGWTEWRNDARGAALVVREWTLTE